MLHGGFIHLGHENVWDYAQDPTTVTVADGAWDDPATWSNGVPGSSDRAEINHVVSLVGSGEAAAILVQGELALENARLDVGTIINLGELSAAGHTEVVFSGELAPEDVGQHGIGLIVGGSLNVFGSDRVPWVAVQLAAGAGRLDFIPLGWQPGDQLYFTGEHAERRSVVEVRGWLEGDMNHDGIVDIDDAMWWRDNGGTVEQILAWRDQFGQEGRPAVVFDRPTEHQHDHVANLSRDVVFRSADPDGIRGHVMVTHHGRADVRGAAFLDLGRTTVDPLGSSNVAGRYSFHWHHAEHAGAFHGNVIDGGEKWGVAIHDSHQNSVTNNVVVAVRGAGIVVEENGEGNFIAGNLTAEHRGSGEDLTARDGGSRDNGHEGTGIWIRDPRNTVVSNVVYDAAHSAYTIWSRFGHEQYALGDFRDNQAFDSGRGLTIGGLARFRDDVQTIDNFYADRVGTGIRQFYSGRIEYAGLELTGSGSGDGILSDSAQALIGNGWTVVGFGTGIVHKMAEFSLRDSHLDNGTNLVLPYERMEPGDVVRHAVVDNVTFAGGTNIRTYWSPIRNDATYVWPRDIIVVDYNGVQGDDFQVYFDEQRADYAMPVNTIAPSPDSTGQKLSYVEGATNGEQWEQYRIAAGGRLMPDDAYRREGIDGWLGAIVSALGPVITDVAYQRIDNTTARVTWTTDVPSTSQVEYRDQALRRGQYGTLTPVDETLTTQHEVTLAGLDPARAYAFEAISHDANGDRSDWRYRISNEVHKTLWLSTSSIPAIYSTSASATGSTTAVVSYISTAAVQPRIKVYRQDTGQLVQYIDDGPYTLGESRVEISGLDPGASYRINIRAFTSSGQSAAGASNRYITPFALDTNGDGVVDERDF